MISYPVVLLTSHGDEEVAVEVMKFGATDYIVKSESTLMDIPRIALSSAQSWEQTRNRKLAEAALRESEARLRCAVTDAPYPIMIFDDEGNIIRLNKMWHPLRRKVPAPLRPHEIRFRFLSEANQRDVRVDRERPHRVIQSRVDVAEPVVKAVAPSEYAQSLVGRETGPFSCAWLGDRQNDFTDHF